MDTQNTSNLNPQEDDALYQKFQKFLKQQSLIGKNVLPKITDEQYAKLVEFMEGNGDLSHRARYEPRYLNEMMWHELTNDLNSMNVTHPSKLKRMSRHWKATWRNLKVKAEEKQITNQPLTALEERIIAIMRRPVNFQPGGFQPGVFHNESNIQSMPSEEVVLDMDPENVFNPVVLEDEVLPAAQATSHLRPSSPPPEQRQPSPSKTKQTSTPVQMPPQPESIPPQTEQIPSISKEMPQLPEQRPSQPDVTPSTSKVPPPISPASSARNVIDSNQASSINLPSPRVQRKRLKLALWTSGDFVSYKVAQARVQFEKLREKNRHEREMRRLDLDSRRIGTDQQLIQALNRLADTTQKFIEKFG